MIELMVYPPIYVTLKFCPKCGRNDRVMKLRDRHFHGGILCEGELKTIVYFPKDSGRSEKNED
jgi:hypothetical protein